VGKRVASITMDSSGVELTTEDGLKYSADIAVGADGVHSVVRAEMRRIAEQVDPSYFKGDETSSSCPTPCSFIDSADTADSE